MKYIVSDKFRLLYFLIATKGAACREIVLLYFDFFRSNRGCEGPACRALVAGCERKSRNTTHISRRAFHFSSGISCLWHRKSRNITVLLWWPCLSRSTKLSFRGCQASSAIATKGAACRELYVWYYDCNISAFSFVNGCCLTFLIKKLKLIQEFTVTVVFEGKTWDKDKILLI